jgi:DoxX-like family
MQRPSLQVGQGPILSEAQTLAQSRWLTFAGWAMTALMVLFLLFDGASKVLLESHVVEATKGIGYPLATIRPLGIICLVCTLLYAIPRTSVLGAILLTAYLGGAVASKVRIEDPLFSSVLFGVYFGLLVWGGLFLRDDRLRALIPLRR